MKKSKLYIALMCGALMSGCQLLTSTADVAADTILVSTKIDAMQSELAPFATNDIALAELDDLQEDVFRTLSTGEGFENILSYQARGKLIYNTLTAEIIPKWDLLTAEQQELLIAIDNELIELNENVDDMVSSTGLSENIIETISQAVTLMAYYTVL